MTLGVIPKQPKLEDFNNDEGGYYEVAMCSHRFDEAMEEHEHAVAAIAVEILRRIKAATDVGMALTSESVDIGLLRIALRDIDASGWSSEE